MIPAIARPVFRFTVRSPLLAPRRLRYEPLGSDEASISLSRDPKLHGIATEYSASLSFVKDGRAYLQRAYQAAGIEADVQVAIEQADPNAFAWLPYYTGRVNFGTAEFTATTAKVSLEQPSFLQKFLARSTVKVDLLAGTSVSGSAGPVPQAQPVLLHSRAVLQRYAASQKAPATVGAQMFGDEDDASREQVLYLGFDTRELNELGLGAVSGGFVASSAAEAVPIFRSPGAGDYRVELALYVQVEAHNTAGPKFERVDRAWHFRVNGDAATATRLVPDLSRGDLDGDFAERVVIAPRVFTVTLAKDDAIFLYAPYYVHEVGGGGTGIRYRASIEATVQPGSYLRITAITTTAATTTTGLLLYEALERTAQALTDEPDVFRSDFFGRTDSSRPYPADGPGALTLLTGGFQVRGFPLLSEPAPAAGALDLRKSLVSTWDELFDSLQAAYAVGLGLEWVLDRRQQLRQVLRVEHFAHFYPAEVVLDLTGLGRLAVTTRVLAAGHYQVVETGYDKWQASTAGGLDEFNAQRQWTTPLASVDNTYSRISKLSASGVLLEATRRDRYDATATTDTNNDTTSFLVCLLRTGSGGFETERNQLASQLSGVLDPASVYNLRLSPRRLLGRHAPAFTAGLPRPPRALVRATSGEGNGTMVSQLRGEPAPLGEGSDVALADLPPPLWRAERYAFQAPVSREQLRALLLRPTGRVRLLDAAGQALEGWVQDFKHTAGTGDFTLIPCA